MGSIKMGIGLGLWHHGMPDAATLLEYVDKAEAWGIDSVWLSDHLMGPLPEVAAMPMSAPIAARTQRLKFGPSVMMLPLRHPITVAKEMATLDFLAPGRAIMAVGLALQRHFNALTKFAHVESRFCGRKRRGKAAFDVPLNPCSRSVCSRSVAVGLGADEHEA